MSIISYVKNAIFTKRESKKTVAKRKISEFRGLSKDCTAEDVIQKFRKNTNLSNAETIELNNILAKKGDSFKFELLRKDFDAGAEILSKVYNASECFHVYKRYLLDSGKYINSIELERIVQQRLKNSEDVRKIVLNALESAKTCTGAMFWIPYPDRNHIPSCGEWYEVTMYDSYDKEYSEPYVRTAEYRGNGVWTIPKGMKVVAYKELFPYIPSK